MIFVDSNMWCYYFDQRLPEHAYVREPMREIIKKGEIACNTIIVMEVAHYLVRHFPAKAARRKIEYFVNLENMKIADFDKQIMMEALDSLVEHAYTHGLGGRDATVIATLKKLSVNKVFSHDNIFKRLATKLAIEVMDPIPIKP
ncbi:MAG: type II toxin-antitoxin system VapC family toxin [Candidatus Brockarchaeota archaeon]|nr:type II toxin-antitoxin system VapC family toxin [Candidatus Brockarchaeota archaeon]MBO3808780.1 type II toxin-antitoxin system VapC family toxin [Candidatus Brockarchaeota archaeon]